MSNITKTVVDNMSYLIAANLRELRAEEAHPSSNPDASDEKIKHLRERVVTLRGLREQFENIMATVADPGH